MRTKTSAVLAMVAYGWLALPLAAPANAFLDPYKAALKAIEAGEWVAAESLLRNAIAQRPTEARRLPRHAYLKAYLPHYYLGLVLYEQGRCADASLAWAESEGQGVIRKRRQYNELQAMRERCAEVDDRAPASGSTQPTAPSSARSASRSRGPSERTSGPGPAPPAPTSVAEGDGQRLEHARATELISSAQEALAEIVDLTPLPAELAAKRTDVEAAMTAIEGARDSGSGLAGANASLATTVDALRAAAVQPPEILIQGAEAYLAGDHDGLLRLLDGAQLEDPRAVAQAHLLLAGARFALYRSGDELDPALLEAARADVAKCQAADPALKPPSSVFSPAFIRLFAGDYVPRQPSAGTVVPTDAESRTAPPSAEVAPRTDTPPQASSAQATPPATAAPRASTRRGASAGGSVTPKAIKALYRDALPDAAQKDGPLEASMMDAIRRWKANTNEPLAAVIVDADWRVERHPATGVLVGRDIGGVVLEQASTLDGFCFRQKYTFHQPWAGSGFGATEVGSIGRGRQLECLGPLLARQQERQNQQPMLRTLPEDRYPEEELKQVVRNAVRDLAIADQIEQIIVSDVKPFIGGRDLEARITVFSARFPGRCMMVTVKISQEEWQYDGQLGLFEGKDDGVFIDCALVEKGRDSVP